jgi:hypothetical protein
MALFYDYFSFLAAGIILINKSRKLPQLDFFTQFYNLTSAVL